MSQMQWPKLLSCHRFGKRANDYNTPGRSPFQQDFDRIIFSSAFRRLQDKTQVFPLSGNDYVRTRLTHSLEASSIGRSLGTIAGTFLCENYNVGDNTPSDIGNILAAAVLAHDIGNPPLGHSGEEAIRHWFRHSDIARKIRQKMSEAEQEDIWNYEGNAQGFRTVARLEHPENYGGMQLTCATLGAFSKYPTSASETCRPPGAGGKKFGFFLEDAELFREVAETTGMVAVPGSQAAWYRHPLALLVEAADDITYRIVDFEDALKVKILEYEVVSKCFNEILRFDQNERTDFSNIPNSCRRVEAMRARVLGVLVKQVVEVFCQHQEEILNGEYTKSLICDIPASEALEDIFRISSSEVYNNRHAVEIGIAGYELTFGLLNVLVPALEEIAAEKRGDEHASILSQKMMWLLPEEVRPVDQEAWQQSSYLRLLRVLDFLTSLTDSHAVTLYRKFKGIALPGGILSTR